MTEEEVLDLEDADQVCRRFLEWDLEADIEGDVDGRKGLERVLRCLDALSEE